MAECLPLDRYVTPSDIKTAARQWVATGRWAEKYRHTAEAYFTFHATKWLRSLGRLQEPASPEPFAEELDAYIRFEEQERGLALASLVREKGCLRPFFDWAAGEVETLRGIKPDDISRYFAWQGIHHRWKRTTLATHVIALRNFFRFAESRNLCVLSIRRGSVYGVPAERPAVARCTTVDPRIFRERSDRSSRSRHAVVCAIYGFRSSEVRNLTLDDIDWEQELIRVNRSKQRKTQHYPLVQTLGDAVLRYLREVRPRCSSREVFSQPASALPAIDSD